MEQQFRVVRGDRILAYLAKIEVVPEQLHEVSTVPQLQQNIQRAFPHTRKRQHATGEVTISNVQYIPYIGTKLLHVRSQSMSNGHAYRQALQFVKVEFEPQDTPTNATFMASDGTDYHVQPLTIAGHNVKVRCNCLDFHFRFANYNSQDKSLVGRPPPLYHRKTTTRPPVNPDKVPGMCKHIIALVQQLQKYGLIKP